MSKNQQNDQTKQKSKFNESIRGNLWWMDGRSVMGKGEGEAEGLYSRFSRTYRGLPRRRHRLPILGRQ